MAINERQNQNTDPSPSAGVESLRAALAEAGIVLPSLGLDVASPRLRLVELGRVRADVAVRLAQALHRGGPAGPAHVRRVTDEERLSSVRERTRELNAASSGRRYL